MQAIDQSEGLNAPVIGPAVCERQVVSEKPGNKAGGFKTAFALCTFWSCNKAGLILYPPLQPVVQPSTLLPPM